jgi:hypothetical protein
MIAAPVIAVPLLVLIVFLGMERVKAGRNRAYKSLEAHNILNASSREEWMSGRINTGNEEKLNRPGNLVILIGQIAAIAALGGLMIASQSSSAIERKRLDERLSELEAQVHALAVTAAPPARAEAETGATVTAAGTPMQQACANLIGRVADAYEKGESSKIGQALEGLVDKLHCVNGPAP